MKYLNLTHRNFLALTLLTVATSSSAIFAGTRYLGEDPTPATHFSLNYLDYRTNSGGVRTEKGNIGTISFRGTYKFFENAGVRAEVPAYFLSSGANGGSSKNALGNVNLGGIWSQNVESTKTSADRYFTFGYFAAAEVYLPSSQKNASGVVASSAPTTELFRFQRKATTFNPTAGVKAIYGNLSGKTNLGYALVHSPDTYRSYFQWQAAFAYRIISQMEAAVEYNTLFRFKSHSSKWADTFSPSVAWVNPKFDVRGTFILPIDKATRRVDNYGLGLKAAYFF